MEYSNDQWNTAKVTAYHIHDQVIKGNAASILAAHLFFPSLRPHLHPQPLRLSSLSPGLFSVGKQAVESHT